MVSCLSLSLSRSRGLVRIKSVIAATGHGGVASYPDFLDWRSRNHVFDGLAAFRTEDFTLTGLREPMHLQGAVAGRRRGGGFSQEEWPPPPPAR